MSKKILGNICDFLSIVFIAVVILSICLGATFLMLVIFTPSYVETTEGLVPLNKDVIESVVIELDTELEYYYNKDNGELYYKDRDKYYRYVANEISLSYDVSLNDLKLSITPQ